MYQITHIVSALSRLDKNCRRAYRVMILFLAKVSLKHGAYILRMCYNRGHLKLIIIVADLLFFIFFQLVRILYDDTFKVCCFVFYSYIDRIPVGYWFK